MRACLFVCFYVNDWGVCACVCVRVCTRECVRVRVCVRLRACVCEEALSGVTGLYCDPASKFQCRLKDR